MDLTDKKFLVIGGAGLIGSHVVDELLTHPVAKVRVYDNFSRGSRLNLEKALADPRVEIFPLGGDILHTDVLETAMEGMDGVFHLAALWLLHCWDYPRSAFEVNVGGTFNVLEALIKTGVPRLVYSSSASVYGDARTEPMDEDHPFDNTNFYGATKVAGEQMCRALYHRYKGTDKGFEYAGLRYMNVYGPRQDYKGAYVAVIMKMLDRLDQGLAPLVFGDGSQAYDFVYVADCARANVAAMAAQSTDQFYNVGTGKRTTVRELAELVLEITGSSQKIQYEPGGMTFVKNRIGSTGLAQKDLGFTADTPLEQGLKRLMDWRSRHMEQVAKNKTAV